jgi:chromosome segregation ATPase
MGLIDAATAPLRYVLHSAEGEAEAVVPLRDIEHIQSHMAVAVEAIKDATEQIEAHVEVIEKLAASLIPLTDAVVTLTAQLGMVTEALAPVVEAEQEVSKLGHIFSRNRQG